MLSLRRSLCSFSLCASSFWYSAASDFFLAILFFLSAILARFLWRVKGVTRRWILGALLTVLPGNNKQYDSGMRHNIHGFYQVSKLKTAQKVVIALNFTRK